MAVVPPAVPCVPDMPRAAAPRASMSPYLLAARHYLRVLGGLDNAARRANIAANTALWLVRLRDDLRAARQRVEQQAAATPGEQLQADAELEWLCNQCEHWLGPAEVAALPHDAVAENATRPQSADKRVAVTRIEHFAVRALWRTVRLLGWFRRQTTPREDQSAGP